MHLIIARYNENLDWLKNFEYSYTIYNKGKNIDKKHYINVSNKGRESESYLRFIVDNYNNLPKTMIFLQGNPFPHCKNLSSEISNYKDENFYFLGKKLTFDYANGLPNHRRGLDIPKIEKELGLFEGREKYYFMPGAQFIVKSNSVYYRSYEWWKNAYDVHNSHENSPWVFERLWGYIFSK